MKEKINKVKENLQNEDKKSLKDKIAKTLFLAFMIVFAIPTIFYYIKAKTIFYYFGEFDWLSKVTNQYAVSWMHYFTNIIGFFILITGITIVYIYCVKNVNRMFKDIKNILKYILIVSIIGMFILPFLSSDIFYYMATGRIQSHYKVNPYYTSVEDIMKNNQESEDDLIVQKVGVWKDQTIVYGPVWPLVCAGITGLSFGNLDVCLFLFKLINLIMHMLNCILIYKLCKKKKFVALYGLNPLVLFESLVNVHNDIWVVFFMLFGIYLLKNKNKYIEAIISLAIATAIKYVTVLLMPFIVIWYFRKENVPNRIKYALFSAFIYLAVVLGFYALYINDMNVLNGIMTQQDKLSKAIISVIEYNLCENKIYINIIKPINILFIIQYCILVGITLFDKNPSFIKYMRKYNLNLMFLILGVITNFWPWYLIWAMATIIWQKGKTINNYIYIMYAVEAAMVIYFAFGGSYKYDLGYDIIAIILFMICKLIESYKLNKNTKRIEA